MTGLFEKILVATDGSEKNAHAIDEAVRIAKACNASLAAVYVMDITTMESASASMMVGEEMYEVQKNEAKRAFDHVHTIAGDYPVETVILQGRPVIEIVRYAAEKKIDLIVIGTQGKHGLERLLLGSVAENVIRSAGCKVLIVK